MSINMETIEAEANRLHQVSSQYYLSHAVAGCEKLLEKKMEDASKREIERLTEEIMVTDDDEEIERLAKQKDYISASRSHIFVDYIDFPHDCARALMINSNISISLPQCLKEDTTTDNRRILRRLVAHEIGHIVLHTDNVINNQSPRGTLTLTDTRIEEEAEAFADKILQLRCEHYQQALESREFERY